MSAAAASLGTRLLRRFPTTAMVSAPYAFLFLPLALWNDNPRTDFIIATAALALAGTLLVELPVLLVALAERRAGRVSPAARTGAARRTRGHHYDGRRVAVVARTVTVASVVANLAFALLGGGTLTAQVAAAVPSGVLTVLSPFVSMAYVAVGLLVAAHFLGGLSRAATVTWLLTLIATQAAIAYITNLTARTAVLLTVIVVVAVLTRVVPRAWLLAGVGVCVVVWPTVYAIRNSLREANGIDVADSISASDRLRFDEQIVRAEQFGPGHDLGQPGLWDALRYGLVPRFLDPGRPPVSSGNDINVFLGGSSVSSYTFMPVATTWFFWGALGVVALYALWATITVSLRPWDAIERRPVAMVVLSLVAGGPLAWFSTPPDAAITALQTLVSAVPVLIVLLSWARRPVLPTPTGTTLDTPSETFVLAGGDRPVAGATW